MDSKDIAYQDYILRAGFTAEEYNAIFIFLKDLFIYEVLSKLPGYNYISSKRAEKLRLKEKERLDKLLSIINNNIDRIDRSKIDMDFVNSEEFARIVFQVFEKVRIDYREDKIKYYANLLINYSTHKSSNDFYKEGMINRIAKYEAEHIIILKYIYENEGGIDIYNIPKIHDIEPGNIRICIIELAADGFLNKFDGRIGTGVVFGDVGGWYFKTPYGEKCLHLIQESYYN